MASLPEHLMSVPAGRDRLPKEVLEEHQRDRVLNAAIGVFAKRGYPGTTVDHLVAASKTGVGSFYSLFGGKEECFLMAYDRAVAEASDRIAAVLPEDGTPAEQICAALRELLALVAEEPLRARLVVVEAQTAASAGLGRYQQTLDRFVPYLRQCREASPVGDELPVSLEEAILGGVAWLLHQRLVMGQVEGIEGLLPDLVDIVLAPYVGVEEAARLIAGAS